MEAISNKIKKPSSPVIIKQHTSCGVNVEKIVRRILKYNPREYVEGLKEIALLDEGPNKRGFSSYWKEKGRIELYVKDIVGWQPWIIKKTFVFPYLSVGLALGHEIDHHVCRNQMLHDKEDHAECNAYKYVYPSFGIFKPLVKLLGLFLQKSPWNIP